MAPAQPSSLSGKLSTLLTKTEDEKVNKSREEESVQSMVDEQEGGLNCDDCKMETGSSFELKEMMRVKMLTRALKKLVLSPFQS